MGVSSKTAAVSKMHGHGVMIDALLGGTEAMRAAGKTYLPQWPQEEDDGYQARLGTSTLLPVLKETIGQMVGRVFFRDIGTDKVSDGLKDYLQNFDLQNNALNVFCAAWFADALAKGASYVLVDYPDGKARTKAEEKALGLRPYAVFVRNSDVLGFRYEMRQGRPVCTQFRYRQAVTEYDGDFGDPTDNTVTDQLVGNTVTGVTRYQLVRSFGGFVEPVLAVKDRPAVKVGGRPLTYGRDYAVTDKGVLVLNAPQAAGQPITWSGGFYFRVRFMADTADFENIIGHLWAAKKIEFVSVKL